MSNQSVSRVLRGEVVLNVEQLDLICLALGLSIAEVTALADQQR